MSHRYILHTQARLNPYTKRYHQSPNSLGSNRRRIDTIDTMEHPPQRATLQTILDQWDIPPENSPQRLIYFDLIADIFHDRMEEYQEMLDNHDERPSRPDPYDERLHDALYTVQLMTMALKEGHYRIAALALETIRAHNIFGNHPVMRLAIHNLDILYPHVSQETTEEIALWLLQQYGSRMYDRDVPVAFIAGLLNVPIPHDDEPPL